MSKTKKRVLSVLAFLFAVALVFTACFALTGCNGDDEGGSTPADWTEYKFEGTSKDGMFEVSDDDPLYLYVWSDGTFWAGQDSSFDSRSLGAGTNGWWGYFNNDLAFVTSNGSDYTIFEMATSGNSITLGFSSGMYGTCTVTIPDIGCLAGNTGYDLVTLIGNSPCVVATGILS